jgi:hypothetical protein
VNLLLSERKSLKIQDAVCPVEPISWINVRTWTGQPLGDLDLQGLRCLKSVNYLLDPKTMQGSSSCSEMHILRQIIEKLEHFPERK